MAAVLEGQGRCSVAGGRDGVLGSTGEATRWFLWNGLGRLRCIRERMSCVRWRKACSAFWMGRSKRSGGLEKGRRRE